MKTTIFILGILLVFFDNSCNTNTSIESKDFIITEHSKDFIITEPIDTTGYFNCREMHGIGPFIINKSIYQNILALIKREMKNNENYNQSILENESLDVEFDLIYSSKYKYLKHPKTKRLKMYDYYIKDIHLSGLKLYFYEDTLIKIQIERGGFVKENSWDEMMGSSIDFLEKVFINKYGIPKINVDKVTWKNLLGNYVTVADEQITDFQRKNFEYVSSFSEKVWENKEIITSSIQHNGSGIFEIKSLYKDNSFREYESKAIKEFKDKELLKESEQLKSL